MTRLYFVRHGESEGNKYHRFLGNTDLDLSPLGYQQAELAAQYFKNIHIDALYSSPLQRAYHTAEPIAKILNLPIIVNNGLREIEAGEWENQPYDTIVELYAEDYSCWLHDIGNARCTGGESIQGLQERAKKTIRTIVQNHPNQTVCIATHAAFIRTLMCHWKNLPISEMNRIPWVGNASVTCVDLNDSLTGTINEENHMEHLGSLTSFLGKNV